MKRFICRVCSFEMFSASLLVRFGVGSERVIDFRPILTRELCGPLCDLEIFDGVRIGCDAHIPMCPGGRTPIKPRCMTGR